MIRYVPQEGVNGYNLTSHDIKPTKNIKTGSMVFETDTQDRYFFNEETSEWIKYTGPILDFYTPIAQDVFCFFGLSTDEKPTNLNYATNIGLGSIFVEIDKSKAYIYDEDGWKEAKDPSPAPQPVLQDKTVNPTINAQQVTYDSGYDGLGIVSVNAVTNAIDNNIKAENIKKDIAILGITGTYEPATPSLQDKTVAPKTIVQTVQPDEIYDGLHTVTVNAVTSSIDNNIQAANIKKDITILGVTGTYEPVIPEPSLQDKTVDPKTTEQIVHADEAYDGLNTVKVSAVTNSIDSNIQAANIKKDVTILGITGSYEPVTPVLQDKTVAPKTTEQVIHADEAYDGLDDVTVSAVTSSIDNNIQAANIKKGVTILGVVGTYEGTQPAPTDIDCTFDNTGHPESADVFVYGDDISRASGTFIIDGVDYSNANLKMNSAPLVNFHTDGPTVVEIYIAPLKADSINVKVDNELVKLPADEQDNPIAGIITITTLPAGCHTILKGSSKETALCRLKVTHVVSNN